MKNINQNFTFIVFIWTKIRQITFSHSSPWITDMFKTGCPYFAVVARIMIDTAVDVIQVSDYIYCIF